MAYSFQELLAVDPPPPGSEDTVDLNLIISQEDGRSAWGTTTLAIDHAAQQMLTPS